MDDAIDKFKEKFKEEALDNVANIEESLFQLENEPDNKELIEKLFRSMHTIKGGGAMFGFNDLSTFTHNLETIYDLIRNDKLAVNKDVISLTFESLDYIRQLLDLGELTDPDDIARQKDYINRIQKYFPEGEGLYVNPNKKAAQQAQQTQQAAAQPAKQGGKKNYLVNFFPLDTLLNNGSNPFFIIDDLTALGDYKTIAYINEVKPFGQFTPLSLGIKWQIILSTEQDINDIKDVFIFVEDECKVDIKELPDGDIVSDTEKLPKLVEEALSQNKLLEAAAFEIFKQAKPKEQEPKAETAKKAAAQTESKISSMRVSSAKIDELVDAVSELVTMQAQLNLVASKIDNQSLLVITEQMEKLTRQLRENSFELSLIPLQGELVRFQRLVRDLCNKLGKQMKFVVEGGDIELDKNIIEHLTDPLLHIIRNSGDHGIELPDERIAKGKNPEGIIKLKAFYSGSSVVIKIMDDGKGMDPNKILKKAIEKGLVDPSAKLTKKEILGLVFASGFSTSEKVTDVSGRGVGMDVVKSKIAEIRGEVSIDSEVDQGTTITLDLPLTLSIIDGLLTKVNDEQFVIPLSNIERIVSFSDVEFNDNSQSSLFVYNNEQVMCINLNKFFYSKEEFDEKAKIVLIRWSERLVGLVVDQVLGEYQIVVKPLGRFLRKIDMISGASVMGDGSLSLVIDTTRLVNFYNQRKYKVNH